VRLSAVLSASRRSDIETNEFVLTVNGRDETAFYIGGVGIGRTREVIGAGALGERRDGRGIARERITAGRPSAEEQGLRRLKAREIL